MFPLSHMMKSFDSGRPEEAALLYKKAGYLLFLLLAPTTGFAIVYGKQLLGFVFGDDYSGYGYLLRWYAVIYLGLFLTLPLHAGLRAIEFTRPLFLASLAGTLFTLVSVYPLIYWLGLTGVMGGLLTISVIQTVILTIGFGGRLKGLATNGN